MRSRAEVYFLLATTGYIWRSSLTDSAIIYLQSKLKHHKINSIPGSSHDRWFNQTFIALYKTSHIYDKIPSFILLNYCVPLAMFKDGMTWHLVIITAVLSIVPCLGLQSMGLEDTQHATQNDKWFLKSRVGCTRPGNSLSYMFKHQQILSWSLALVFVFLNEILIKQLLAESKSLLGERLDHSGWNFRGHGLRMVYEYGDWSNDCITFQWCPYIYCLRSWLVAQTNQGKHNRPRKTGLAGKHMGILTPI